ncbi:DUF6186 family protein [Nocardia transvalensis]|uniref:DUF6186 family protein n=1 Tax=Nocardia transvalensis TaxID=37333 RepID=UPI0018938CCD|nr:DUF6186 family protein [Nocardia transvalensis]MBF6327849.1 hypothetical protein [Nocardia transvalensis]
MSERVVIIAGFVVLLVITLGTLLVTHLRDGVARLGETIAYLTRTRAATVVAILMWGWIGWHFLAR